MNRIHDEMRNIEGFGQAERKAHPHEGYGKQDKQDKYRVLWVQK